MYCNHYYGTKLHAVAYLRSVDNDDKSGTTI